MKKTIRYSFLIMVAGMIFCFVNQKFGEEEIQAKLPEPEYFDVKPSQVSLPQVFLPQIFRAERAPKIAPKQETVAASGNIIEDIRRAQNLLETKSTEFEIAEKKGKGKWEINNLNVLLAFRQGRMIEYISVNQKTKRTNRQGYLANFTRLNGVATDFSITQPEGCVLLAIRRVVKDEEELFREVVYTPYIPEIDCDILRKAGLLYLKNTIDAARKELKSVKSRANPKVSVAEAVPSDLALMLAVIEHIDPGRLKREKIEKLINEVLVTIGANQQNAYRYSISKKGARALLQIMPKTYSDLCKQYPGALNPNFIEGTNDPFNACKAALLLFDSDLCTNKSRPQKDPEAVKKYLASAYNCGAGVTINAIRRHRIWENKVPKETRLYLKKFVATCNILSGTNPQ